MFFSRVMSCWNLADFQQNQTIVYFLHVWSDILQVTMIEPFFSWFWFYAISFTRKSKKTQGIILALLEIMAQKYAKIHFCVLFEVDFLQTRIFNLGFFLFFWKNFMWALIRHQKTQGFSNE